MKDHQFSFIAGIVFAVLGLFAHYAHAADLGMKDSPRAAVTAGCDCADTINWAGLSVGIQAGGIDANHDVTASSTFKEESSFTEGAELNGLSSTGFLGHVTLGYDVELGSSGLVAGVKGWYGISNADTTLDLFATGSPGFSVKLERQNDYGAIVRLGRVLGSDHSTLAYVGGGWQQADYNLSATGITSAQLEDIGIHSNQTYSGPVVAAGVEHAFTQHIFGGVEYRHWFAGSQDWANHKFDTSSETTSLKDRIGENAFEATLRYKF